MNSKYCPQCECLFFYKRESAKFCSPACRQKALRIRQGQTVLTSEANRRTTDLSERKSCPYCNKGFWTNTKGRKRRFCSDSCRVSANRVKMTAAFRFVERVLQMPQYDAFMLTAKEGTTGIDKLAESHGYEYSDTTREYYPSRNHRSFVETSAMFPNNA